MRCPDPDALKDVGYRGMILRAEPELDAKGSVVGYRAVWTRPDMSKGQGREVWLLAAGALREGARRIDGELDGPPIPLCALCGDVVGTVTIHLPRSRMRLLCPDCIRNVVQTQQEQPAAA